MGLGDFVKSVGNSISSGLSDLTQGARELVTNTTDKMFDEAYNFVEQHAPETIAPVVSSLKEGTKKVYQGAVEWLDPVTFAVEGLENAYNGRMDFQRGLFEMADKAIHGRAITGEDWEKTGKSLLNYELGKGALALSLIPGGTVGKAVVKPAVKTAKAAAKQTVKSSATKAEKKVAKRQLREVKLVGSAGTKATRAATIYGKHEMRGQIGKIRPGNQWTEDKWKDRGAFTVDKHAYDYLNPNLNPKGGTINGRKRNE